MVGHLSLLDREKKKKIQIWSNLQLKIKLQPNPQKLVQGVIH